MLIHKNNLRSSCRRHILLSNMETNVSSDKIAHSVKLETRGPEFDSLQRLFLSLSGPHQLWNTASLLSDGYTGFSPVRSGYSVNRTAVTVRPRGQGLVANPGLAADEPATVHLSCRMAGLWTNRYSDDPSFCQGGEGIQRWLGLKQLVCESVTARACDATSVVYRQRFQIIPIKRMKTVGF
jgi:hypothetical protein